MPYFAGKKLDRITPHEVTAYMGSKQRVLAPKMVANHIALLEGLFRFALRRGAATRNPVELIDRPRHSPE